jgi:sugar phosphate permease
MLTFSWRWMFIIMGLAGLVMAAIWRTFYRNPLEVTLTDREIAYCTQGDPARPPRPVTFREWRMLFKFRTTWGMMMGFFGVIYISYLYNSWLPGYFEIQRHMSLTHAGIASAIPFASGVAGSMAGGYCSHRLIRAGYTARNSCKIPAALALVGTACFTITAAYVHSNTLAIAGLSAAFFLNLLASTCSWALSAVAVPPNLTASAGAMMNFAGYIGGALAPTVTGLIVQRTGSFVSALEVGAVVALASALSYMFIVPGKTPDAHLDALDASLAQ